MARKTKPQAPGTQDPDDDDVVTSDLLQTYAELGTGPSNVPDIVNDPAWVRSTGKTPIEFLTAVYRHPLARLNDRISAAKTVMEYTHRKVPSTLEVGGINGGPLKVSADMLAGLSDKELETLQTLLEKAARVTGGSS